MKKIIICVDLHGIPSITTEGYAGQECLKASSKVAVALGQIQSDEPTTDFYQEALSANQVRN